MTSSSGTSRRSSKEPDHRGKTSSPAGAIQRWVEPVVLHCGRMDTLSVALLSGRKDTGLGYRGPTAARPTWRYYYAHEEPGEVKCHDVFLNGGNWYVVQPNGDAA